MSDKEFYLREAYSPLLRYWWLVLLCAVVGAILGLTWSHFNPPLFESSTVIEAGVDYGRTEAMDAVVQQHALDRVRSLLLSDETLEGALERVRTAAGNTDPAVDLRDFRRNIRLTERGSSWGLKVINADPVVASEIANAWAKSAIFQLETAIFHAWRVQELQDVFFQVGCTLESEEEDGKSSAMWVCYETQPEIDPNGLAQEIQDEANLSKGILPSFSFWISQEAQIPDAPIVRGRGSVILAGAALGGCIGVVASITIGRSSALRKRM